MLSTESFFSAFASDRGLCSPADPSSAGGSERGGPSPSAPAGLSPSDFVKRKLHQRLMAGRAKTLSPAAEATRRVMTPEAAGSTILDSTHAHNDQCGLLACSVACPIENRLPLEDSILPSDVGFSPVTNHQMSVATSSTGSGSTSLKRPNPFGFASSEDSSAVGRCSPKRIVFPFSCDRLAAFPGNLPLSSLVVEDAVHRLRMTEQAARSRKKKSRRTPKVKKIKFHEYTGPNRRITAQKSKSVKAGGTPSSQTTDPSASTAAKEESSAAQQPLVKQAQKGWNLPTTLNLNLPPLQPPERTTMLSITDPLRAPNLVRQIPVQPFVARPCTTVPNTSMGLTVTHLQNPKPKESICGIKLPPNTPPVAKAGTSAPLLVPVVARRKDPSSVTCGGSTIAASQNGVDRKTCRRDTAIAENLNSLDDLKVTELKEECKKRKLSVTGPKPRLLGRLLPFADDILNERNLQSPQQSKSVCVSHPKHIGDVKQDSATSHCSPLRVPDVCGRTVQTSLTSVSSDQLKSNSVVVSRVSSGVGWPAAHVSSVTTASTGRCDPGNPATCRPQLTNVSTSIGCPQRQKIWDGGRPISWSDLPLAERRDSFKEDVLIAFCKEMSEGVSAAKHKSNGTLSGEQMQPLLSMGAVGQALVSLSAFHDASRAESLCHKVPHPQQFLTPPATPTLLTNGGCVPCSSEFPTRGTDVEPVNTGPCFQLSPNASRDMNCRLSPKLVAPMMPLTGAELWMLQEKQIAELHLQLQKSKVELCHARMKVCLQQQLSGGDHRLTPGIAAGKPNDALDGLISLAQLSQVSSRIEQTGVIIPTDYGNDLKTTSDEDVSPTATNGVVLPNTDRHRSQSGSTGLVEERVPAVSDGADDGRNFPLRESPSQSATIDIAVEEIPPQSQKEYSDVMSSPDASSDAEIEDPRFVPLPYFATPAKEPPEYHEAIRQKLMLMQNMAASVGESTESSEDLSLGSSSSAAFSCSTSGSVKREEIEDVIEVLFGSGADLAAIDNHPSIPVSDRMWLDDVRAVIRDLVLSAPSYFMPPLGFEPDSPEMTVNSVDCGSSQPEARWPPGRTETVGPYVSSGQGTECLCVGAAQTGLVGLGVPWGRGSSDGAPSSSSDDLSYLPCVGFDWNDPSELDQPQFSWGSFLPTASDGGGGSVTSGYGGPRSFCPNSVTSLPSVSTPTDPPNSEDDIIPSVFQPPEEGTPVSPDVDVDSSSDLLTPAGTVDDLRWEGEWMDVFDGGRRMTESATNLFPAFAFSP